MSERHCHFISLFYLTTPESSFFLYMQKAILIKNGTLCTSEMCTKADILIEDGKIAKIAEGIDSPEAEIIDASGRLVTYGLADVHVHFRVPGRPDKETIATGSAAAAHGGYTCVCPMPNLSPAPDSPEHLEEELRLIREEALVDVRPYATITKERKGFETVDVKTLKGSVCGFSDDGSGVQDEDVMKTAMQRIAAEDCILAAHCEDNSLLEGGYIHKGRYAEAHGHKGICSRSEWGPIERDCVLAEQTGCAYHVCHVSTKESVEVIRQAKARGVNVTCETGPHYLTMCEEDLQEDGRFKMNPPLRGAEDREALLRGICDGTVDMIATDHAPHTAEEKARGLQGSAMGVVGLETAFAVVYTGLVKKGVISFNKMVELMSEAPRKRFRLGGALEEGQSADIAVWDIDTPYTIEPDNFLSKGRATPFAGWKVYGKCLLTLYKGRTVWKEKQENN